MAGIYSSTQIEDGCRKIIAYTAVVKYFNTNCK